MRYQYKWQDIPETDIPPDNQANLEATIRRSLELGINHIETARGYGTSEMQLGKILPTLPRQEMIVQTKVAPTSTAAEFLQDFHTSLGYLHLDYVDLLSIHGINNQELLDYTICPGGCLDAAKKLQQEGKVKFIGFSTHGSLDLILDTLQTNQFDYVNLHWYYINQGNWQAIELATQLDLGVFIISPSNKGGLLYEPSSKLVEICQPLTPMVFNDLFCLSHPQVHTLSIGAAKPQDFEEHLLTLNYLKEAPEILAPIVEKWQEAAITILGEEWVNTWQVGLPKIEETPTGVNIPMILWLRNLALAYDMREYAKMRYNLLTNGGHWFPGSNAAQVKQLDLRACLSQSPHGDKIPQILAEAHDLLAGASVKRLSQS
jgi:predicted aldo/keto reductase-like oxidoreductase